MTPSQIIALLRDIAIVAALTFLVWRVYSDGANSVKVADMQAVQKQLQNQAQQVAQWRQEAQDAENTRTQTLAQVAANIGAQRDPVRLCVASHPDPVPVSSKPSTGSTAATGPIISAAGDDSRDLRGALNDFELKLEKTVADCRLLQQSWPR